MTMVHPDYSLLASRVAISNLHKETESDYLKVAERLYHFKDKVGRPAPLISDEVYEVIKKHHEKINAKLDYTRDFKYDFFGFKTLEKSYLLRVNGVIAERP